MNKSPVILVTGCGGQVGFELQRALAPLGQVVAVDFPEFDLCDEARMAAVLERVSPEVIVNPAAYTAVDKAEADSETAYTANAKAPGFLAQRAREMGALLVHYSTDYVYDGQKEGAYTEEDTTGPLSVYGASKLAGDQAIIASGCRHVIFRTTWVYGIHGNNFAKTMLRLARDRSELRVVADQWGVPTPASLLADVTAHAVRSAIVHPELFQSGLYHLTPSGETTWFEYARFVIEEARKRGMELKVEQITPIAATEFPTPARRPVSSRLDTTKLRETYGLTLAGWETFLSHSMGLLMRNL